MKKFKNVWAFVDENNINNTGLLSVCQKLADDSKEKFCVLYAGEKSKLDDLKKYRIDIIFHLNISGKSKYDYKAISYMAEEICRKELPNIVIFPADYVGKYISSRIGAKLETGLTADCTKLSISDEDPKLLVQSRPAFDGNVIADIVTKKSRPQLATYGVFSAIGDELIVGDSSAEIIDYDIEYHDISHIILTDRQPIKKNSSEELEKADIVIAFGRGIGSKENIIHIEKLAGLLNAGIAVTKAVVDLEWYPEKNLVGQTGISVTPKLYIAFGVAGALQHMVGVSAKTIIAVNSEKNAPIFDHADIGIVGDCIDICRKIYDELS